MKKKVFLLLGVYIFFQSEVIFAQTIPEKEPQLYLSQKEVSNGNTIAAYIQLPSQSTKDLRLECNGEVFPLFNLFTKNSKLLVGFIPIAYNHQAGSTLLTLRWKSKNRTRQKRVKLKIVDGQYPKEQIKVDPSKVTLSDADLARVHRERGDLNAVYNSPHLVRYWRSNFVKPIDSVVTSPYGVQRLFNGQLRSAHTGVDLRAATGTPIHAMNHGVVRLMKNLFFAGNAIILDHGLGLYSSYSHLSKFSIKLGQRVKKGEVIGLSGSTGRVNAPHLHWQVKVNDIGVCPLQFTQSVNELYTGKGRLSILGAKWSTSYCPSESENESEVRA